MRRRERRDNRIRITEEMIERELEKAFNLGRLNRHVTDVKELNMKHGNVRC